MTFYKPDPAPNTSDRIGLLARSKELGFDALSEYVYRELTRIGDALDQEANARVQLLEQIAILQVPAGYAVAQQQANISPFTIGVGAWVTIPYDTLTLPEEAGIVVDLTNDTFQVKLAGNWRVSFIISLTGFNNIGTPRQVYIRLYNITKAISIGNLEVTIRRSVTDLFATYTTILNIPDNWANDILRIEIGNPSAAITGGTLTFANTAWNYIDKLGSLIIPGTPGPGDPSQLVGWIAGADTPIISGPDYVTTTLAASVYDNVASDINFISTDGGKYYAEFEVVTVDAAPHTWSAGWKQSARVGFTETSFGVQIVWAGVTGWGVNHNAGGGLLSTMDTPSTPAPANGLNFGIAIDCAFTTPRVYVQVNGTWRTSGGGTFGGIPGVGLGWSIANPGNRVYLYGMTTSTSEAFRAITPRYLPAGYTAVT